jgi:hypothetical protein
MKMETSEEDIIKEELKKSADDFKTQLEVEVNESLVQAEKAVKTTAVIAGGALLGYAIYKVFFESEESKKKHKKKKSKKSKGSDFLDPVLKAGAEMATTFLLSMARRKLVEYMSDLDQTFESSNGHSQANQ